MASGSQDGHDNIINIVVAPQSGLDTAAHKSRFRAGKVEGTRPRKLSEAKLNGEASQASGSNSTSCSELASTGEEAEQPPLKVTTPPSTPQVVSSDLPATSDAPSGVSPILPRAVIPESPYNPLQTPAFRHSPPPLPSDYPWKYCSPSNPLSLTRNLSLTALVQNCTPLSRGSPNSRFSSPCKASTSRLDLTATPLLKKSEGKSSSRSFLMGPPSSTSPIKRHDWLDDRFPASPLRNGKRRSPRHQRQSSDLSDSWIEGLPSADIPLCEDPFDESWGVMHRVLSPPRRRDQEGEPESPILRGGGSRPVLLSAFEEGETPAKKRRLL